MSASAPPTYNESMQQSAPYPAGAYQGTYGTVNPQGYPPAGAVYPPPGGYDNKGVPVYPSPPAGYPAGAVPSYQTNNVVIQPPTQQVVLVGGCPACRLGILEDDFTCLGVLCAILFFPIGVLCCLAMRQRRCNHCGAVFG